MTEETQAQPAPTVVAESVPAAAETSVAPAPEVTPEQTIPKSRFDEVYRHRREAERERDYWRDQAMQAKPKEPEPLVLPTPEQHGFDDAKYQAALIEYNKGIAESAAIKVYQAEKERDQQKEKAMSFRKREAEFQAKNPQYRDKVYGGDLHVSEAVAELIAESPDGPALAYFLADNFELAEQIYGLPPVQAAREIGKIEARMAQKAAAPPKPILTNVPPPPPSIEATEPAVEKDPAKMSDAEFAKWRKRQIAQRR